MIDPTCLECKKYTSGCYYHRGMVTWDIPKWTQASQIYLDEEILKEIDRINYNKVFKNTT